MELKPGIKVNDFYRVELERIFIIRKENNPQYSLRSFSRDIKISPSTISGVLANKRSFSKSMALRLVNKIYTNDERKRLFILSCEFNLKKKEDLKKVILKDFNKLYQEELKKKKVVISLQNDFFSSWEYSYVFLIIQKSKKGITRKQIVSQYKLDKEFIDKVIPLLESLNFITLNGLRYTTNPNLIISSDEISLESIRKYNVSILDLGKDIIKNKPISSREFQAGMFTIEKNNWQSIKDDIKLFRDEIYEKYNSDDGDKVILISTQSFIL